MDDDDNDLANIINYVLGVANRLSQQPVSVIYLSMFSPRGVPQACVGHLTSIAFPTLGNLTKNLGPRVGAFAFFAGRNEIKSCRPTRPDFRFVNGQCPYR